MERTVTYFETLDPENTDITFRLARGRVQDLGIRKIVIASTTGATAKKAMEYFKNDVVSWLSSPTSGTFTAKSIPSRRNWQRHCGTRDMWFTSARCFFIRPTCMNLQHRW